jgi:hypothetical protein
MLTVSRNQRCVTFTGSDQPCPVSHKGRLGVKCFRAITLRAPQTELICQAARLR